MKLMEKAAATQIEAVMLPVVLEAVKMQDQWVVRCLLGLLPYNTASNLGEVISAQGFAKLLQAALQHMPSFVQCIQQLPAATRPE
jgi:hypothetical protein